MNLSPMLRDVIPEIPWEAFVAASERAVAELAESLAEADDDLAAGRTVPWEAPQ